MIRRFDRKTLIGILACAGIAVSGVIIYQSIRTSPAVADANTRPCVCIESGKVYFKALQPGDQEPILSPFTDKRTGYFAEACYWTRDGKAKKIPDYVVLNRKLGREGKTICPECGREVVGHNPMPPADLMKQAQ